LIFYFILIFSRVELTPICENVLSQVVLFGYVVLLNTYEVLFFSGEGAIDNN